MLTQETIKLIEKALGIKGLQEIIESKEETTIKPTNVIHWNQETYDKFIEDSEKRISPETSAELKRAGEEMAVKEIKRRNNFEFEGKSVEKLFEYLNTKIKANGNETEQIKNLTADNEALKKALEKE